MHYPSGIPMPVLVAAISDLGSQIIAVQCIYLRPNGHSKAHVSDPKLTLGRLRNGACRLAPAGRELGLAEGTETGLSAMELYDIPVWAACGSRLNTIAIPEGVRRLVIFADRGTAGVVAAERAAFAQERPQREIAITYPPAHYKDWNDLAVADATEASAW
jgi:hypothetical protein